MARFYFMRLNKTIFSLANLIDTKKGSSLTLIQAKTFKDFEIFKNKFAPVTYK